MVTAIEQYEFTKSRSFSRRSLRLGGEYQNLRHRRNPRLNIVSSCRVSESYPVGGNGIPAGTTNYIYYDSNWQAIETRTNGTADSDVTSQMVWSASYINAAVLQDTYSGGTIQPNSRLYFEYDANWNTTAVVGYNSTTQTWDVVQRYTYSPYGTITVLNTDWSTPASGTQPMVNNLYQGMTLDSVTGLYYERNRNYSLSLRTWTSQDPDGYINGANTYQFVMSNPVGSVDPSGKCVSCWLMSVEFTLVPVEAGIAGFDSKAILISLFGGEEAEPAEIAALLTDVLALKGTVASFYQNAEACEKCNPCPSNIATVEADKKKVAEQQDDAEDDVKKVYEALQKIREILR